MKKFLGGKFKIADNFLKYSSKSTMILDKITIFALSFRINMA